MCTHFVYIVPLDHVHVHVHVFHNVTIQCTVMYSVFPTVFFIFDLFQAKCLRRTSVAVFCSTLAHFSRTSLSLRTLIAMRESRMQQNTFRY
jgi:hypothetical protein